MLKQTSLSGKWKESGQEVSLSIPVILFKEDGYHYAYMPALDLNGYGHTEMEAKESLKIMLDEFLHYSVNKKTLIPELKRLGWTIKSKKKMRPPKISDILAENEELRNIIDCKQYVSTDYQVHLPQPV